MRSLPLAIAALGCVALVAGCGASHAEHTTTSAQDRLGRVYGVQVYFCVPAVCPKGATKSQERQARTHLQHEACVRRVVFISKAKALAEVSKSLGAKNGGLPPGARNPLPDSFVVLPDKPSCALTIATAARTAHWAGVQNIDLKRRVIRAGS
jgi:cell division protein FtsX